MKEVFELHQIKKGKIDYIMKANVTIKKKKLSFLKQEISMPLHALNEIINECQLYQRIATEGMTYQISSEQSNVKGQKFFQYKKAMLRDSSDTIEIQIVGKKLFSLLEEKKCYKLDHLMITAFNQCKYLRTTPMTKITNIILDVAEPLPSCDNEVLLIWLVDVTDTDT